ncbi:MAG: diaminopimelate epimerase [Planctomycetes bacterium]|nr:diaminopimelate epimerase [Planctomycetota bacterium]
MRVPFVKMEGAGNDYVFVDAIAQPFPLGRAGELARRWSDRHFGIGGDGLIALTRGVDGGIAMQMWNADGSRGAMCGNGLRCLARLAYGLGHVRDRSFVVATDAGPRRVEIGDDAVRTEMGAVLVADLPETAELGGVPVQFWRGDAGNPHAVIFCDDPEIAPVDRIGMAAQIHPTFPGGVNVEFVAVAGTAGLRQRTFERGSGETLACGTGAAVAALAACRQGRLPGPRVAVALRGGVLLVELDRTPLVIEGPARTVFRGEIELPDA